MNTGHRPTQIHNRPGTRNWQAQEADELKLRHSGLHFTLPQSITEECLIRILSSIAGDHQDHQT